MLAVLTLLAVLVQPAATPGATRSQLNLSLERQSAERLRDADSRVAAGGDERVSDAEIRRRIVEESIASYDGPCACPYQRARNGSRCGRRSAYDREGGEAPLCFPSDVSDDMVRAYRAEHGL